MIGLGGTSSGSGLGINVVISTGLGERLIYTLVNLTPSLVLFV